MSGGEALRRRKNMYASPTTIAEPATPTPAPIPADSFLLSPFESELESDDAPPVDVLVVRGVDGVLERVGVAAAEDVAFSLM